RAQQHWRHGRGDTHRGHRIHGRRGHRARDRRRLMDPRHGRRQLRPVPGARLQGWRDRNVPGQGSPHPHRQRGRRAGEPQRSGHRVSRPSGGGRRARLRSAMTLPNALSAARAVLVIPVIGLIATGDASLALLVFLGAAATDALDGPLARRRGATAFGAALDPFADKILVVGTLAALAIRGIAPAWAIVLILARELVAIEVRARAPQAIGAGADGKAKTVLQVTAIAMLLATAAWP